MKAIYDYRGDDWGTGRLLFCCYLCAIIAMSMVAIERSAGILLSATIGILLNVRSGILCALLSRIHMES